MKTKYIYSKITVLLGLMLITTSCDKDLSDEAVLATFSNAPVVFNDTPVGMGTDFYFPYNGSFAQAWTVDEEESYEGTASMRFDVPDANNPGGGYAGGIFRIDGAGRNLTEYDALTFWAKATQAVTIAEFGFGEDFGSNTYQTTRQNVQLTTNWTKVVIPIPDASKLTQERGMFRYSAAGIGNVPGQERGYTFWVDELKFERLGTLAQPQPKILNGVDVQQNTFNGATFQINGTQTFNDASGQNITVVASPSYFDFSSSDTSIASVSGLGTVTVNMAGTATVTAVLGGTAASGSLALDSAGDFVPAPDPTLPAANVTSIYSDFYSTIAGFNPGAFAGANTANIQSQTFAGNNNLNYESIDFVGLSWDGSVNASGLTHVHLDVQLLSTGGSSLVVELVDFGPDNTDNGLGNVGADGTAGGFNVSNQLVADQWVSLDIPLSSFTLPTGGGGAGSPNLSNLGYVVFVSSNGASFLVDNIYFY